MAFLTSEQRRLQQRDDIRRAILAAAEAVLAESGYTGFSMRRLTERCGYTAPTLYHHFGDKTGLLDAVLEERFRQLIRLLRRVPEREDPAATIVARARAFVRFGLRNPTHYRILMLEREPGAAPLAAVEEARAFFERPWRELAEAGRLQVRDIEIAQRAAFSLMHGLISLHNTRPDLGWTPAMFDESIDAVLRGLIAASPAPRARSTERGTPARRRSR